MTDVVSERVQARSLIPQDLFARLVQRITIEDNVDLAFAERIMDQAIAFLSACAMNTGEPLAPSPTVDIGWHTFILYTREYTAFCDQVAGRLIHHVPDDVTDTAPAGDPMDVRGRTVEAIERAGFVVDEPLWWKGAAALCSQCHNGCYDDPPPDPPEKK